VQCHAQDLRAEVDQQPDADAFVHQIVRDWRAAALDAPTRALLEFAELLTRAGHQAAPAHLDALRRAGWDDAAIHDAVQVIAYFNYINRVADGLGVERETFIPRWGGYGKNGQK
jgi:uncharacterized peroxidase-related enzyme